MLYGTWYMGASKNWDAFLGLLVIRIIIYWGLIWDALVLETSIHIPAHDIPENIHEGLACYYVT